MDRRSLGAVVRPVLGAAEIAGNFGVPYIGGIAAVLKGIQENVDKMAVHKHECRRLANKASELYNTLVERQSSIRDSELRTFADEVENTLLMVQKRTRRWASYSRALAYFKDGSIAEGIKDCDSKLDVSLNKFHLNAAFSMAHTQTEIIAMLRGTHEEFRSLLLNQQDIQLVAQMHQSGTGEHVAETMMERGQQELRELRQRLSIQPSATTFREGQRVQPELPAQYRQFQEGLAHLHRATGIPPSVKILDGEVVRLGVLPLAGGTYSDIWEGTWLGDQKVALKALRGVRVTTPKAQKRFERELNLWSRLSHPNILSFLGIVTDIGNFLHMVSPWQDEGNVLEYSNRHPNANKHHLITGAAQGLAYLHSQRILHGNMKCANILVTNQGESVICDFGMAKVIEDVTEQAISLTLTRQGSVRWLAPEIMSGDVESPTLATDVYSFSLTIFECFTSREPFPSLRREAQVIHNVVTNKLRPERPPPSDVSSRWITDEIWEMVNKGWSQQPEERPPMGEIADKLQAIDDGRPAGTGAEASGDEQGQSSSTA
ncbi:kinase-like protein [Panus rudis PR-1116 ss-1]|nr:kinase-like protein [Panus rudis PR-1116 ss-1]